MKLACRCTLSVHEQRQSANAYERGLNVIYRNLFLPVIGIIHLSIRVLPLPDTILRCRIYESEGMHSPEFYDSTVLKKVIDRKIN